MGKSFKNKVSIILIYVAENQLTTNII